MSKDFVQLAKYYFISTMYIRFMSYSLLLFHSLGVGMCHCANYAIVFSFNLETVERCSVSFSDFVSFLMNEWQGQSSPSHGSISLTLHESN